MKNRNDKNERFESYPKPTETDQQLKNQPEYIDELPEESRDRKVGEAPSTKGDLPERNRLAHDKEE